MEGGYGVDGRSRLGWMDGVKVAFGSRRMTVEADRQCAKDRGVEFDAAMYEFHAANFAWPCVLSDPPPEVWWIITWRWVGYRYVMRLG